MIACENLINKLIEDINIIDLNLIDLALQNALKKEL